MSTGKKAIVFGIVVCFVVVVAVLYSIIYVTPKIEGIGKDTTIVKYEKFPVQDSVTGIFVREETLYTAAYSGKPEYMIVGGTKIRAGTQVVYIDPGAAPPQEAAASPAPQGGAPQGGLVTPTLEEIGQIAAGTAEASEGGVSPMTAIVSYYADGYEKKISPDTAATLSKDVLETLPDKALNLERPWVYTGEPVYKITNNNSWRFAFWIEDVAPETEKRYVAGTGVSLAFGDDEMRAVIELAEIRDGDLYVILLSDMYYSDLDKYRKQDAKVIFSVSHGAVIDSKAISERAGVAGVYVRQQSGAFKWVPIKILRESEGRCLVAEGSYEDSIGGKVSTVQYYDEIMSDPDAEGY